MKKNKFIQFVALSMFLLLVSCEVAPKDINYGNDHCHFCDMTVVDKTHAAQYVTKKGKSYMFDAVECLVRKINTDDNESEMAFVLVADYNKPGELVNASSATYLISEKIKSPMGANLSSFNSKEIAEAAQYEFGGELFTWDEIKTKLSK